MKKEKKDLDLKNRKKNHMKTRHHSMSSTKASHTRRSRSRSGRRTHGKRGSSADMKLTKSKGSRQTSKSRRRSAKSSRRSAKSSRRIAKSRRGSSSRRSGMDMSWASLAPRSTKERAKMSVSCFLSREDRKYPTCPSRSRRPTCQGTFAARSRAVANGDEGVVAKADRQAKVLMCGTEDAVRRDSRIVHKSLKRSSRTNKQRRERRSKKKEAKSKPRRSPISRAHLANMPTSVAYRAVSKKKGPDV